MALVVTRGWQSVPLRSNGRDNIDNDWFDGQRLAGLGSINYSKISSITYDLFSTAAQAFQVGVFNLTAKEVIFDVFIRPTTKFEGGGASSATLSLGIIGDETKYFPAPFDVFQQATVGRYNTMNAQPENWAAGAALLLYLQSDVNLDQLTAGEAEVYVGTMVLP